MLLLLLLLPPLLLSGMLTRGCKRNIRFTQIICHSDNHGVQRKLTLTTLSLYRRQTVSYQVPGIRNQQLDFGTFSEPA
jgi:hypothetical protein